MVSSPSTLEKRGVIEHPNIKITLIHALTSCTGSNDCIPYVFLGGDYCMSSPCSLVGPLCCHKKFTVAGLSRCRYIAGRNTVLNRLEVGSIDNIQQIVLNRTM